MTKELPTTNDRSIVEVRRGVGHWSFEFSHYLVIRISSLVIPLLVLAIRAYQLTLSPLLGMMLGGMAGCRYTPTCSAYAAEALREHGAVTGTFLAAKRICRCQPWGGCGHDPVPPKKAGPDCRVPKFI